MYNHSLFYNHLTLPIFGRNKTGHFDDRWEMLYYVVGRSFSLWVPGVDNSVIVMMMVISERLGAYCVLSIHAGHVRKLVNKCSHFQPGVVNGDGYTPLGLAVKNERLNVVKYLITEENMDPNGTYK